MTLSDLINKTRVYCRDNNSLMFAEANIKMFINEGIDRLRQYKTLSDMPYLVNNSDTVSYLPEQYQYLLALFASSRCYDSDERFYEGIEKRNEFESVFSELINEIESENIEIIGSSGESVCDIPNYIDCIKDVYFDR